jgi:hypothetical protein
MFAHSLSVNRHSEQRLRENFFPESLRESGTLPSKSQKRKARNEEFQDKL